MEALDSGAIKFNQSNEMSVNVFENLSFPSPILFFSPVLCPHPLNLFCFTHGFYTLLSPPLPAYVSPMPAYNSLKERRRTVSTSKKIVLSSVVPRTFVQNCLVEEVVAAVVVVQGAVALRAAWRCPQDGQPF